MLHRTVFFTHPIYDQVYQQIQSIKRSLKSQLLTAIRIRQSSFNLLENVGSLIFSLETIYDSDPFKIFQTVRAINAFLHTPSNLNLLVFYRCDTRRQLTYYPGLLRCRHFQSTRKIKQTNQTLRQRNLGCRKDVHSR